VKSLIACPVYAAFMALLAVGCRADPLVVAYDDLRGPRLQDAGTGVWKIAWWVDRDAMASAAGALRQIEGMWWQDFGGPGKYREADDPVSDGVTRIGAADLAPHLPNGLELPHLGIQGDVVVLVRSRECPLRFRSDADEVAVEDLRTARSYWGRLGMAKMLKRFREDPPSVRLRKLGCGGRALYVSQSYLDSSALDSDGDGRWNPRGGVLLEMLHYRLPALLDWVAVVPATWFDVPARSGNGVEFSYFAEGGERKRVRFPFDPDYLGPGAACRVSVMSRPWPASQKHTRAKAYLVQSWEGRGVIIGEVGDPAEPNCLAIAAGTLRVAAGSGWVPRDRVPKSKRRWIGNEGYYTWPSEHCHYEESKMTDWGYDIMTRWGERIRPMTGFNIQPDPYTDFVGPLRLQPDVGHIRATQRYGVDVALFLQYGQEMRPLPNQSRGEVFNPEAGTFGKAGFDWADGRALAWRKEQWKGIITPYKGTGLRLVHCHEGGFRAEVTTPIWSESALASFREYLKNPEARFPVAPHMAGTDRTDPGASEKDFARWLEWVKWVRTRSQHLLVFEAAREVLSGDPDWLGGIFMMYGAHGVRNYDLDMIAASPATWALANENPTTWEHLKPWHEAARSHGKKIFVLQTASSTFAGLLKGGPEIVDAFRRFGVEMDVDGLTRCGLAYPDNHRIRSAEQREEMVRLWKALHAKYYGKSRMSVEEADGIIEPYAKRIKPMIVAMDADVKTIEIRETSGITIDGNLADWNAIAFHPLDRFLLMDEAAASEAGWSGPDDLSARMAMAWDKRAVYLAVKVRDQAHYPRTGMLAEGDQVEWLLSFPDPRVVRQQSKRAQFLMYPGDKAARISMNIGAGHVPGTACGWSGTGRKSKAYVMEAEVPWRFFNAEPAGGDVLAFDVQVLDRDHATAAGLDPYRVVFSSHRKKPWKFLDGWAAGRLVSEQENGYMHVVHVIRWDAEKLGPCPAGPVYPRGPRGETSFFERYGLTEHRYGETHSEDSVPGKQFIRDLAKSRSLWIGNSCKGASTIAAPALKDAVVDLLKRGGTIVFVYNGGHAGTSWRSFLSSLGVHEPGRIPTATLTDTSRVGPGIKWTKCYVRAETAHPLVHHPNVLEGRVQLSVPGWWTGFPSLEKPGLKALIGVREDRASGCLVVQENVLGKGRVVYTRFQSLLHGEHGDDPGPRALFENLLTWIYDAEVKRADERRRPATRR